MTPENDDRRPPQEPDTQPEKSKSTPEALNDTAVGQKASQALKAAVDDLLAQEEIRGLIIGEPSFAGLVGLSNTAFTLRVSFTTLPLKQWTVRFALDTQVKKHFDRAGVRAPVQTWQQLPMPGADSPAAE